LKDVTLLYLVKKRKYNIIQLFYLLKLLNISSSYNDIDYTFYFYTLFIHTNIHTHIHMCAIVPL